jgi:aminopeptidase N
MRNLFRLAFLVIILTSGLSAAYAQAPAARFNRSQTYDVQHYIIRLTFDRKNKRIFGDTTVQLKPLVSGFDRFELDAAGLRFESVKLDPGGADLEFDTSREKVSISLPKRYTPGELISVRLKYSASPKKGLIFVDEKPGEGRPSHIWTDSEPFETRYWFPSFDFPSDKATSEQYITVDKSQTVIGNGELISSSENPDATVTWHYKMPFPHPTYLSSFVVGRYAKLTARHKDIPLGFFVFPGREAMVAAVFSKTAEMMSVFEERTGVRYPFNKYDQAIVSNFKDAGMENLTATILSENEISFLLFKQPLLDDLIAHELAHSWFGNLVTCRNWAELWLNEGLATFMEAVYREKRYGRADYLSKIRNDTLKYMVQDNSFGSRQGLFNQRAIDIDAVFDNADTTYNKGAAVIHMLRETVGETAFWKGINLYLTRHRFGSVESTDLRKVMEETSGQDLGWFFSQWVYGGGYPKLEVEQVYDSNTQDFRITVSQIHKSDALTPAVFVLPLDLEFKTEDGVRREVIKVTKRQETFLFKVGKMPSAVLIDTGDKVPVKSVKTRPLTIIQ